MSLKEKVKNPKIILIFLVLAIVLFCSFLVVLVQKNSECVANPLVYGAKEVDKQVFEEVTCSCDITGDKIADFTFDKNGLYQIKQNSNSRFDFYFNQTV